MDYSQFSEKTIITYKFAVNFGWNYQEIWGTDTVAVPYDEMKDLLKLMDALEKDEKAFVNLNEAAGYKNLLRLHGKKD